MKKLAVILLSTMLIISIIGCARTQKTSETSDPVVVGSELQTGTDTPIDEEVAENPEFHYTGHLYIWDSKHNDYQGGYELIDGPP